MAARFSAWPPNGAATTVAAPVEVTTVRQRGWKPKLASTAMPVRFCETIVTTNRGTASASTGPRRKSGATRLEPGRQTRRGAEVQRLADHHGGDGHDQAGGYRPAAREAQQHRPHRDHREGQLGRALDGLERLQAERQQHPGQHGCGQGPGDSGRRSAPATATARPASATRRRAGRRPPRWRTRPRARRRWPAAPHPGSTRRWPPAAGCAAPARCVSAPISTDSAISPDAASAGEAPTPRSPASTTANAPPKPTRPETIPAAIACPSPGLTPTCPGTGSSPARGWPRSPGTGGARRRRTPPRRRGRAPAPRRPGPPASGR